MNNYVAGSGRVARAIAQLQQEIGRNRITVTTKQPNTRFPDGYQVLYRGSGRMGMIGLAVSFAQFDRTGSFNG